MLDRTHDPEIFLLPLSPSHPIISVWSHSTTDAFPFLRSSTLSPMVSDTMPSSKAVMSIPPMEMIRETPRTFTWDKLSVNQGVEFKTGCWLSIPRIS